MKKPSAGYAHLLLALALPISASLAWMGLLDSPSSRARSQRSAAIATMRSIASAQAYVKALGAIDTDGDGIGEFGFFGELAGTASLRIFNPATGNTVLAPLGHGLVPPILPPAFSNLYFNNYLEAFLTLHGYHFKMYLPLPVVGTQVPGVAEKGIHGVGGSTAGCYPDPDLGESMWACYAWPIEVLGQNKPAYFMDHRGRLIQTANSFGSPGTAKLYEGWFAGPTYDAALSDLSAAPGGLTGLGAPLSNRHRIANDGNIWTRLTD